MRISLLKDRTGDDAEARQADERDKDVAFTNCISDMNNTQINNAKDIDIVMAMYNLTDHSDNYFKKYRSL